MTTPVNVRLKAKYRRDAHGPSYPRKGAGNGVTKHAPKSQVPVAVATEARRAAQAATAANRKVLVLDGGRKRRFVRADALS